MKKYKKFTQKTIKWPIRLAVFLPIIVTITLFTSCYLYYINHYLHKNAQQNIAKTLEDLSEVHSYSRNDTKYLKLIAKQYIATEINSIWIEQDLQYFIIIGIAVLSLILGSIFYYRALRYWLLPLKHLRKTMQNILQNKLQTPMISSNIHELRTIEQACVEIQSQYIKAIQDAQQNIETTTADLQQSLELLEEKNIQLTIEKKKTEEKSKQRSELILNMSHEIRTPINGVVGFTNLLLETNLDPIQKDYVDTIKSSAKDLLEIINEILDYAKMDADKLKLDNIPIDLRTCVEEVVTLMTPAAQKNAVDLIVITHYEVPKLLIGDPLRIKQILHNLIGNAIKFSPNGKVIIRIKLGAQTDNRQNIVLSVQDTGIGISPKNQTTLFQAFQQVETVVSKYHGGSGLGLAICKKLAELMGGNITLKSALNEGSTFTVQIQLERLNNTIINSRFAALNILCFDTDDLYLESIENTLQFLGANYKSAQDLNQLSKEINSTDYQLGLIGLEKNNSKLISIINKAKFPCFLITKKHTPQDNLKNIPILTMPLSTLKIRHCIESVAYNPHKKPHDLNTLRLEVKYLYPSILVVEDHKASLQLLENILNPMSYLKISNNGYDAIKLCHDTEFNVIILDYNLPDMNALELIGQISAKKSHIIIMSACIDSIVMPEIKHNITLIEKPIEEHILLDYILNHSIASKVPEIDWALCVKRASNNESFAQDFMKDFVKELEINHTQFREYLKTKDIKAIAYLAHKLYGACCFCGVPKLQHYSSLLESLSKNATNTYELEDLIKLILLSIESILENYKKVI